MLVLGVNHDHQVWQPDLLTKLQGGSSEYFRIPDCCVTILPTLLQQVSESFGKIQELGRIQYSGASRCVQEQHLCRPIHHVDQTRLSAHKQDDSAPEQMLYKTSKRSRAFQE